MPHGAENGPVRLRVQSQISESPRRKTTAAATGALRRGGDGRLTAVMKHAPLNPNLTRAIASPIMEAGSWLEAHPPPPDRKLIDLRQAVPAGPPSDEVRRAMA